MKEKITKILEEPLKNMDLKIDEITLEKQNLNIILDSDTTIDLDRIVNASKIINEILDKEDLIKDKYLLDISSKEKGDEK